MDPKLIFKDILEKGKVPFVNMEEPYDDEFSINVNLGNFKAACLELHKVLKSPVMMLFATDVRAKRGVFTLSCVFSSVKYRKWITVTTDIDGEDPRFESLSKEMYSASLFEREIKEMFGIEPAGSPDSRRLKLHDEVWPEGLYPLRKDFPAVASLWRDPAMSCKDVCVGGVTMSAAASGEYKFKRIEGEGVFEIPVGPVHAGIIGPGHFRFSVAGEPIINMEARLGFTHRGVEKILEGRTVSDAVKITECVSGDASFGHSLAFCQAVEKICGINVPEEASVVRAMMLELERLYNHAADIGGMAVDVGFSFPSAYASIIKESILALNKELTGSRYLKNVNRIGGVNKNLTIEDITCLRGSLKGILKDFGELKDMLYNSVSFMDRVDTAGILKKKTAEDLGVIGLAARASGIPMDIRKDFPGGTYKKVRFDVIKESGGDCLARLNVRTAEFAGSAGMILQFADILKCGGQKLFADHPAVRPGSGLGYVESWRGAVLYWVKLDEKGTIERCKIVDPSFHNWEALSFAVLGNIVPDFPLCNKSFDLSYSGNDL
ncbi:MAG: NADH-quinone oxidoreductase subunit C [Candidatus Omnitrophica bacterium]|nr:NADH-quinone oxidoreductase subunit C [Candidatus Omnitrophota bacterium]